ncbi:hypothetical protein H4582DRAFT_2134417 [Lactarius indigo]|nr:hypothetical protein H4582DRAFT_2134417 [Lactarius indigo]
MPTETLAMVVLPKMAPSSSHGKRSHQRTRSGEARIYDSAGVNHRSLPGLSVLQGSVRVLEQKQPSWIEEREQVERGTTREAQRRFKENRRKLEEQSREYEKRVDLEVEKDGRREETTSRVS